MCVRSFQNNEDRVRIVTSRVTVFDETGPSHCPVGSKALPVNMNDVQSKVYSLQTCESPTSLFQLYEIHNSFFVYTIAVISSCFLLTMSPFSSVSSYVMPVTTKGDKNGNETENETKMRPDVTVSWVHAAVVHVWNLLCIVLTVCMYIFSTGMSYPEVPVSNFLYSLAAQLLTWVYCFFHLCDITHYYISSNDRSMNMKFIDDEEWSDYKWVFKLLYMYFSVVVPFITVLCVTHATSGIDEWRVQTIFYGQWFFFGFMGMFQRYKTIHYEETNKPNPPKEEQNELRARPLYYLWFALIWIYTAQLMAADTMQCYSLDECFRYYLAAILVWIGQGFMLLLEGLDLFMYLRKPPSAQKDSVTNNTGEQSSANETYLFTLQSQMPNTYIATLVVLVSLIPSILITTIVY